MTGAGIRPNQAWAGLYSVSDQTHVSATAAFAPGSGTPHERFGGQSTGGALQEHAV